MIRELPSALEKAKQEIDLSFCDCTACNGKAGPTYKGVGAGLPYLRRIDLIEETFSLTPAGIIRSLDLRRPIYKQTATYGHFGRTDVDLPWERLDKVDELKKALN